MDRGSDPFREPCVLPGRCVVSHADRITPSDEGARDSATGDGESVHRGNRHQ